MKKYICAVCGGMSVQHAFFVSCNTEKIDSVYGEWCDGANSWCNDCQEHVDIIEVDHELNRSDRDITELKKRIKEYEDRLQFDPGGSDKIDELEQALQFAKHSIEMLESLIFDLATGQTISKDRKEYLDSIIAKEEQK